jgi:hypothetical protein
MALIKLEININMNDKKNKKNAKMKKISKPNKIK